MKFAFIGMGATGTIGFISMVHEIERRFDEIVQQGRPVHFTLIDKEGRFAAGDPYSDACHLYLLNQRADKMSVYSTDPDDLCKWVQEYVSAKGDDFEAHCAQYHELIASGMTPERIAAEHAHTYEAHQLKDFNGKSYLSRTLYGSYMRNRFEAALEKLDELNDVWRSVTGATGSMIQVSLCGHGVQDVHCVQTGGYELVMDKGAVLETRGAEPSELGSMYNTTLDRLHVDYLYVSTGHMLNNMLSGLRGDEGYADTPLTYKEMQDAVAAWDQQDPVLIVGTGQAMLDAVSSLEGMGYEGPIRMMSGSLVEPWPQDFRDKPEDDYMFSCCSPEHVADMMGDADPIRQIAKALQQEMHSENAIAYGGTYVIARMRDLRDAYMHCMGGDETLCNKFFTLLNQHDNNSTSPEKFAMLNRVRDRLSFVPGRVVSAYCNPDNAGKVIEYLAGKEQKFLRTSVVVNAASMERRAFDENGAAFNPIIEKLRQAGIIKSKDGEAYSTVPCCVIAGPARGDKVWGVYVMRNQAEGEAGGLLSRAIYGMEQCPQTPELKYQIS